MSMKLVSDIMKFKTLRCPKCGKGRIDSSLIKVNESCSNCKFQFKSGAEGWAGPSFINYIVTVLIVLTLLFFSLLVFRWQYIQAQAIVAVLVGVLGNVFFYRYAHSFWIYFLYFTKFDVPK